MLGVEVGGYELKALLGVGDWTQVFRGEQPGTPPVAVKVVHHHLLSEPGLRQRFLNIGQRLQALRHERILPVYACGEERGDLYLITELADGSLRDRLQPGTPTAPLPLRTSLRLVRQVVEALAVAEQVQVVHAGIKPENIMRLPVPNSAASQVKVADFGLAALRDGTLAEGAWTYLAPEQCQRGSVDGRSDLYALGIVLYELAVGRMPFQASSRAEACQGHGNLAPPALRSQRPDLPGEVEQVILKCLAKPPGQRYPTAAALMAALDTVLQRQLPGDAVRR